MDSSRYGSFKHGKNTRNNHKHNNKKKYEDIKHKKIKEWEKQNKITKPAIYVRSKHIYYEMSVLKQRERNRILHLNKVPQCIYGPAATLIF